MAFCSGTWHSVPTGNIESVGSTLSLWAQGGPAPRFSEVTSFVAIGSSWNGRMQCWPFKNISLSHDVGMMIVKTSEGHRSWTKNQLRPSYLVLIGKACLPRHCRHNSFNASRQGLSSTLTFSAERATKIQQEKKGDREWEREKDIEKWEEKQREKH